MQESPATLLGDQQLDDALYAIEVEQWRKVECPDANLLEAVNDLARNSGLLIELNALDDYDVTYTVEEAVRINRERVGAALMRYHRGTKLLESYRIAQTKVCVGVEPDTTDLATRALSPIRVLQAGYTATKPRYYAVALVAR